MLFNCLCGASFKSREDVRRHIKICSQAQETDKRTLCSICSESSEILLSYGDKNVCPSCSALRFEGAQIIFGSYMINHMGKKYEEIFRQKAENLLNCLRIKTLSEIGVLVTVITFSGEPGQSTQMFNRKGELVFVFSKNTPPEKQEKNFQYVINHEIFHAYVFNKLNLGISDGLRGPFSLMEGWVASFAEDMQLDKIAVNDYVEPYLLDEIKRHTLFYKSLPILSRFHWDGLPDIMKLNTVLSVTRAYSEELWFKIRLKSSSDRNQIKKNLRLIQPHYSKWGFFKLGKLMQEIYEERIAETMNERKTMWEKLLKMCDNWVDSQGLSLY